ncbi:MAG: glycogen synthase GlgA [Ignavibacteria bacterium]
MKVLFATPEIAPWVKTGGLGDVAGALPNALRAQGLDVRVLVPAYPALKAAFPHAKEVARPHWLGGLLPSPVLLQAHAVDGLTLLLLDHPDYFDRPGNPYLDPTGRDWLDNHLRFGLLSRVAAWLGSDASTLGWRPAVVHCNDWQTSLAPAYLHYLPGAQAKSVVTVHNLAFQGLFDRATLYELGLPDHAWHPGGVEYYGRLSALKAGLQFADAITTVSPTYAREIQTDEEGMGMAGLLRHRAAALTGILNGLDTSQWDPAHDPALGKPFAQYDAERLAAKARNKTALQRLTGLADDAEVPLFGVVSRLTHQKGLDLLAEVAAEVLDLPAQLVVLGSGERSLEEAFRDLAHAHPGRCAATIGFDEGLAHRIEAGADVFLMPSRFEPCGLNQMYSLRYGTPPLVRATGGLADTVIDADDPERGNGFVFNEPTAVELLATIRRAADTWRDKQRWQRLQRAGMAGDFSWDGPAQRYVELYSQL